jgi:uncharacterized membrane protein YkvA (DUF1232 family)
MTLWWNLLISVAGALLIAWLALVVVLVIARARGGLPREALRLRPDVLRLIRRLVADKTLPRGVRIKLGLVLAYLALPVDLIPDFIPMLGYADDAIIVTVVLRAVVRRASVQAVRARWPGTDDVFTALTRLTGLNHYCHSAADFAVPVHRREWTVPELYPEIAPYEHGMLDVGDGNLVYWEVCGNPRGKPAVILHGGPGSGCTTGVRQYFDPDAWRSTSADAGGSARERSGYRPDHQHHRTPSRGSGVVAGVPGDRLLAGSGLLGLSARPGLRQALPGAGFRDGTHGCGHRSAARNRLLTRGLGHTCSPKRGRVSSAVSLRPTARAICATPTTAS